MSAHPRFSIVIPTRNRGHLLPFALKSALAQTYDDYEIVVMANDPRDNTRQVVEELHTSRIRYYETDVLLNMTDNWELAWTKARGDYVVFLPDDDALVPDALEVVANQGLEGDPPIVSFQDALYYYPDFHDEDLQNVLLMFHFGEHRFQERPASEYLRELQKFSFGYNEPIPRLLNAVANREFFEQWRQKLGGLFFSLAPDYAFGWLATQVCETIRTLHVPLCVRGLSQNSAGSHLGLDESGREYLSEFGGDRLFDDSIISVPISANFIAATFVACNRRLKAAGLDEVPLDWPAFLLSVATQLVSERESVAGLDRFFPEVLQAAETLGSEVSAQVAEILFAPREPAQSGERLRDLRDRIARTSSRDVSNLSVHKSAHSGDEECATCTLGLNRAVLVNSSWDYLYVFCEELRIQDPYAAGRVVSGYYDLLTRCRSKQRGAVSQL